MSVKIETRSNMFVGRSVTAAAVAGLIGVAITLAVAASLLLGRAGSAQPAAAPALDLTPGYVDFGQRHRSEFTPVLAPGYQDYGQRQGRVSAPALDTRFVDYGQRHGGVSAPALDTRFVDYGQRHRQP